MTTMEILRQAKANAPLLAAADTDLKNKALNAMADCLLASSSAVIGVSSVKTEDALYSVFSSFPVRPR